MKDLVEREQVKERGHAHWHGNESNKAAIWYLLAASNYCTFKILDNIACST